MKLVALLLVCFAVSGCVPPFIEDLNSAAALTRQMTTLGTIGPLRSVIGNGQARVRFLPAKPTVTSIDAVVVQSGFTVTENAGSAYLQFAFVDSSGNVQLTSSQVFSLAGADPNYPLFEFDVTTTTTTGNIVVTQLLPTSPSAGTSTLYSATLPSGPLALVAGAASFSSIFTAPLTAVLGVQMAPRPAAADVFNFLVWNGTTAYADAPSTTLNGGATVFAATTGVAKPGLTVPALRALYYRNSSGSLSYASYFQGGQWVCDQWTPSTALVRLTGVTHRIDAVLTSGDLLSTEGGILRLYDQNGSQVVSVSLGGLQFCYETYVGSTPYVFFSLAIDLGRGNWAFRAYAVPTSSMRGLGG